MGLVLSAMLACSEPEPPELWGHQVAQRLEDASFAYTWNAPFVWL